jgi:hypothetical protein
MNIDLIMTEFLKALQYGQELTKAVAWKNGQALSSLIVAFLALLTSLGFNLNISDSNVVVFAGGIAALVNAYLVIATTKRSGLTNKTDETTSL